MKRSAVLFFFIFSFSLILRAAAPLHAQTLSVDISPAGRQQVIDGFGTALSSLATESWYQQLFLDDLGGTIIRWDLTPRFASPYSDSFYYSPWFGSAVPFPGPDANNARTYTGPLDYSRPYGGFQPPIAVMGPDIDQNVLRFDFSGGAPAAAGAMGAAGVARLAALGDFKIMGTIFSPAPWVKIASGAVFNAHSGVLPTPFTPYPFIWNGNFGGGYLDVSDQPLDVFNDGTGPTSALTQFARSTAAYLRGFQNHHGLTLYAVSIQNEPNFEQYFNSCKYPQASQLAAALKALRTELDRYPDLAPIRIIAPEDLLIATPFSLWQFGNGPTLTHKNLRFLLELQSDPPAWQAVDFVAVHANASDQVWDWWSHGWTTPPAGGLPDTLPGFTSYGKKSWMTETSGLANSWPAPGAVVDSGALGLALSIHRALTTGQESAWLHWQFADGSKAGPFTLTDATLLASSPKFVAVKHFARHIRPDAQRVNVTLTEAPLVKASAYVHAEDHSLTLVLINTDAAATTLTVQLPRARIATLDAFTSDASALWVPSTVAVQASDAATITVPAYGVVTLRGVGKPCQAFPRHHHRHQWERLIRILLGRFFGR